MAPSELKRNKPYIFVYFPQVVHNVVPKEWMQMEKWKTHFLAMIHEPVWTWKEETAGFSVHLKMGLYVLIGQTDDEDDDGESDAAALWKRCYLINMLPQQ